MRWYALWSLSLRSTTTDALSIRVVMRLAGEGGNYAGHQHLPATTGGKKQDREHIEEHLP
jgi:hypothetical protein